MSFYLKNSESYVKIARAGLNSVEELLNITCSVDFSRCKNLMVSLASDLVSQGNCLADYNLENPLVTQAYNDFMAYGMVHQATCLTLQEVNEPSLSSSQTLSVTSSPQSNSSTSGPQYCYTNALFSSNNSADAFLYLLPFGTQYPTTGFGLSPSCSRCTQTIMSIFHSQTNNQNLTIISSYNSAASIISSTCGASFVNMTSILSVLDLQTSSTAVTSSACSISSDMNHFAKHKIPVYLLLLLSFVIFILPL